MLLPLLRPRTDPALLHHAIECLWSAVVPYPPNVSRLVQRDGVLQLLDVLEEASFGPRAHLLPCISDLLSHPEAVEQCQEWHGKKRQSAVQLLLTLWLEEEARKGEAAAGGVIQSTERPLATQKAGQMFRALNETLTAPELEGSDMGDGGGEEAAAAAASVPLASEGLRLTSAARLVMGGRLDTSPLTTTCVETPRNSALAKVDLRAKIYSVLAALGFESSVPLTPEEELLMEAAREYVGFASAEAWRDIAADFDEGKVECAYGTVRPLTPDAAALAETLSRNEGAAADVLARQEAMAEKIREAEMVEDEGGLARVRVLRDGPMGQVAKQPRGHSLFRARIEAKAKIGAMVEASKVGYRGPVPTADEYADATIIAAQEAIAEAGMDPAAGFTVKQVPQALTSLATAAGIDPSNIDPYLANAGFGFTRSGRPIDQSGKVALDVSDDGAAHIKPYALEKDQSRPVSVGEMKQLCVGFQASVGR